MFTQFFFQAISEAYALLSYLVKGGRERLKIYRVISIICAFLAVLLSGCSNPSKNNSFFSVHVSGIATSVSQDKQDSFQFEAQSETAETESFLYLTEYIDNGDVSNYVNAAEKAAEIISSINRKDINALVTVHLIDFTFDDFPELVVSYDTAGGHSLVENDVYDLQSDSPNSIFSFYSNGISRNYDESIFVYENTDKNRFYAFIYGVDSGNDIKLDFVDRLCYQNNEYNVINVFSSSVSMTDDEYINEYHCFGEKVGKIAYDTEKTEWFSCLKPIFPELKKQSVEIENWDETDVLGLKKELCKRD